MRLYHWLSEPLINQVHSGLACMVVHPGMTLVNLILIGYCCDHLVGELNCLASTCWLIVQPRLHSSTIVSNVKQCSSIRFIINGCGHDP